MLNFLRSTRVAAMAGVLICSTAVWAQNGSAAADNSAQNKHHETTADQQHTGASDREITRKIRRALVHDKSLSMYGHNVKIVTLNGAVTLKGPVHSDEEKQTIETKAAEVAGKDQVTDELTVKQ